MGIRDYLEIPDALFLFEWPSKGGSEIPQADLIIDILKSDDDLQRQVSISTESAELFNKLRKNECRMMKAVCAVFIRLMLLLQTRLLQVR